MNLSEAHSAIVGAVQEVVVGQDEILDGLVIALLTDGHVLLEGVPGVGKTLLARSLARVLSCDFARVQFTPDLMPSDVTGSTILQNNDLVFRPGPVFTNFLLGDEINRAPAKTQSALLEAMQERAVTADGKRHDLGDMFMVVATQNPIEQEGTYPLPEAELDRFMFMLRVPYPTEDNEKTLLKRHHARRDTLSDLKQVVALPALAEWKRQIAQVSVTDDVIDYVSRLVRASRVHLSASVGGSPRAGLLWLRAAKAEAALRDRDYVIPDDLKRWAAPVLRHRLVLTPAAEIAGVQPDEVVQSLLQQVDVPT